MRSRPPIFTSAVFGPLFRVCRTLGMDGAIAYSVAGRLWQVMTAPLSQILLVLYLSGPQQGLYYAFFNLLALQSFVELGLQVVLINVASHEWAALRLESGRIAGEPRHRQRLISLGRKSMCWSGIASMVFVILVATLGYWFLGHGGEQHAKTVNWAAPWFVVVTLHSVSMSIMPLIGILEGCGQISVLSRYRFLQAVLGTSVFWVALWLNAGLWVLAASAAVRVLMDVYIVFVKYGDFFRPFRTEKLEYEVSWRAEVLPLQWRIGMQGPLTWMARNMAGLLVFTEYGSTAAAQLGMTTQILMTLQMICAVWIDTRRPEFGRSIARGNAAEAEVVLYRMMWTSGILLIVLLTGVVVTVFILGRSEWWLAQRVVSRMMDWQDMAILALSILPMHVCHSINIFALAHRKDPYFGTAVVSSLSISAAVFVGVYLFGLAGVAAGTLLATACIQLPLYLFGWASRAKWTDGVPQRL